VLGSAYGGATYYALQEPAFRDTFTTYVPGAEQTLTFVQDLQKNNQLSSYDEIKLQAEQYASTAKSFGAKIQDTTNDAIDYATDAYHTLTGQKEAPKLPSVDTVTEKISKTISNKAEKTSLPHTATDTTTTVQLSSDKSTPPVVVNVAIEKPEPIVVHRTTSNNTVVRELDQIVYELASILNQAGLSGLGRNIIKDAESKIEQLNSGLKQMDAEQAAILQSLKQLAAAGDKIEGSLEQFHVQAKQTIEKTHVETAAALVAREAQLKNQFEQTRAEIKTSFAQQLAADLNAQQQRLEQARQQALVAQAQELQRRFVKEVKLLVEQERAGRLAQLDVIDQRFKALEKYAIKNAEALDMARQTHVLHVTLDAFADVLEQQQRQPFVNELQALSHNAKHDKLIQSVLEAIPKELAEEGVASVSELSTRFEDVSDEIRHVALVPEDGGFGSHIISFIMSYLMFKKQGLVEGDDVESILARTGYYLKRDNLEFATRELNQLSGWPKRLAQDWIQSARRHLEVKQALEVSFISPA
jgi:mitofilin